jgi:hypothetical protein
MFSSFTNGIFDYVAYVRGMPQENEPTIILIQTLSRCQ